MNEAVWRWQLENKERFECILEQSIREQPALVS